MLPKAEANHQQLSQEMLAIYLMLDFAARLFNPEIASVLLFISVWLEFDIFQT